MWNYYQKDPSTFAWRGGNSKLRQHTTTGDRNSESPMSASRRTSHRTYCCSRSCFAAGAAAARRARRASDGGDDGGDARGSTTTMVDARISPMPNTENAGDVVATSVARDLARGAAILAGGGGGGGGLGCSAGASGWLSRRLTSCHQPPPPLVLLALRRLLSADASPPVCLVCLPFRLPLVCQLVVASPLLSRRRRLRLATLPRPLLRHLVVATCNAPLVAPPPPLVL